MGKARRALVATAERSAATNVPFPLGRTAGPSYSIAPSTLAYSISTSTAVEENHPDDGTASASAAAANTDDNSREARADRAMDSADAAGFEPSQARLSL